MNSHKFSHAGAGHIQPADIFCVLFCVTQWLRCRAETTNIGEVMDEKAYGHVLILNSS